MNTESRLPVPQQPEMPSASDNSHIDWIVGKIPELSEVNEVPVTTGTTPSRRHPDDAATQARWNNFPSNTTK